MTTKLELLSKLSRQIAELREITIPTIAERVLLEHIEDEHEFLAMEIDEESHAC